MCVGDHRTKLTNYTKKKPKCVCVYIIGIIDSHCTLILKGACVFKDITSHTQAVIAQKWKWGTCWEENMNFVMMHPCII